MEREQAATLLWGTRREREARWARFPVVRRSAVMYHCACLHIRGDVSYMTSLLMAISALSIRAVELGRADFVPSEDALVRDISRLGGIEQLEGVLVRMAEYDELTIRELLGRESLEVKAIFSKLGGAECSSRRKEAEREAGTEQKVPG